jgi:hypothetical protein
MLIFNTKNSIVHYLLSRGLLSRAEIVDGDVVVAESTSRNRNFRIMRTGRPGFFVKHIQPNQPASIQTLQREAACYELIRSDANFGSLAPLVPRLEAFDRFRHVLVLELLSDGESLGAMYRRENRFPESHAAQLGNSLGTYHYHVRREAGAAVTEAAAYQGVFPRLVPWILQYHQMQPEGVRTQSAANAQLHAVLNRYPEFPQRLDELHRNWRADTLIHGDMKFENCVVYRPPENGAEGKLKVVDWEIADFGDGCWDAGAVFQAYLNCWILSMPAMPGISPEELEARATTPLKLVQPAIRAFWRAYAATMQLDPLEERKLLERCTSYAAARMLQTVFEWMNTQQQLSLPSVFQLQVSMNMLQRPVEAAAVLLGL